MKIMFSALFSILLVLSLVGAGTFAYYSDQEIASAELIESESMDLTFNEPVDETWIMNDMIPGVSWRDGSLTLWNEEGIVADHVEIMITTNCVDPGAEAGNNEESDSLDGATDMDAFVEIESMTYQYGPNLGSVINLIDGASYNPEYFGSNFYENNDYIDLADIDTIDDLPAPLINHEESCRFYMRLRFHETASSNYQGDVCNLVVTATLNQDASQ